MGLYSRKGRKINIPINMYIHWMVIKCYQENVAGEGGRGCYFRSSEEASQMSKF